MESPASCPKPKMPEVPTRKPKRSLNDSSSDRSSSDGEASEDEGDSEEGPIDVARLENEALNFKWFQDNLEDLKQKTLDNKGATLLQWAVSFKLEKGETHNGRTLHLLSTRTGHSVEKLEEAAGQNRGVVPEDLLNTSASNLDCRCTAPLFCENLGELAKHNLVSKNSTASKLPSANSLQPTRHHTSHSIRPFDHDRPRTHANSSLPYNDESHSGARRDRYGGGGGGYNGDHNSGYNIDGYEGNQGGYGSRYIDHRDRRDSGPAGEKNGGKTRKQKYNHQRWKAAPEKRQNRMRRHNLLSTFRLDPDFVDKYAQDGFKVPTQIIDDQLRRQAVRDHLPVQCSADILRDMSEVKLAKKHAKNEAYKESKFRKNEAKKTESDERRDKEEAREQGEVREEEEGV